jgi:hypothetical protein
MAIADKSSKVRLLSFRMSLIKLCNFSACEKLASHISFKAIKFPSLEILTEQFLVAVSIFNMYVGWSILISL